MTSEQEDALNKARAILKLQGVNNNTVTSATSKTFSVKEIMKRVREIALEEKQKRLN